MKLNLLAAVAYIALMSSGVLAQAQDNARHEERPGPAKSEAAPVQGQRAEPSQARGAAQTNERSEQGAPRAAQTEGQRAEPSKAKAENAVPSGAAEPNGSAKGRNERAQNGAERQEQRSAEHPEKQAPARTGATEQRQDERNKTGAAQQQGERSKTGAAEQRQDERNKTGAAERQGEPTKTGAAEQRQDERTETGATEQRNPAQTGGSGAPNRTNTAQERNGENRATSEESRGQPRVVGNVRTSPEHASRASEILMRSGRRESVNINVRVGARVPETVTILPVPEDVITFAPEYRGYDYFIENDEIVFVSPSSHEVVGMIEYEGRAAATDVTRVRAARPCPTED